MKGLTKTFIKLVCVSIASVTVLTAASVVSQEGFKSARAGLKPGAAYGIWRGTFYTDDVATYANTFNDPYYYSVFVNGRMTRVTAKNDYKTNYKWASVSLTGIDNKIYYTSAPLIDANKQILTVTGDYNGIILRGFYYACIQNGTGANSEIMTSSAIQVLLS